METAIFYYTGTGNSLWVARTLAEGLGGAEVISISDWMREKKTISSKTIGIIFPVHMWGVPEPVIKFISALKPLSADYIFAAAVDAGQVANTLVQLSRILKKNGMKLASGFEIQLPSNYIPWGGPGPKEKQQERFGAASRKIAGMISSIKNREVRPVEKGPLWQRGVFSLLYQVSFKQVPKMDKSFWVDEKCNHCGICSKVCPAENIKMVEGKPVWDHRCEQCLACIQWCPQTAIQYGKKTPGYERYHHPEVGVGEMVRKAKS